MKACKHAKIDFTRAETIALENWYHLETLEFFLVVFLPLTVDLGWCLILLYLELFGSQQTETRIYFKCRSSLVAKH